MLKHRFTRRSGVNNRETMTMMTTTTTKKKTTLQRNQIPMKPQPLIPPPPPTSLPHYRMYTSLAQYHRLRLNYDWITLRCQVTPGQKGRQGLKGFRA